MIHIKTLAIKKILLLISILFFLSCSVNKNTSAAFKDTYMDILNTSTIDFRYLNPPTFEQSQKGIKVVPQKRPDTLSPLKLYIQKEHIPVNFDRLNQKMSEVPPGFVYQFKDRTENYIPENLNQYSNKIYELIPLENFDEVLRFFKNNEIHPRNFGGVLQFSKLYLNKRGDKALLFVRDTRHSLDSTESLYLLKKKNGKWKVVKSFGISMS